jgi:hypothetical protein|tara:strand:+ start:1237 stop:1866 length:630 start_codon:yes stop_codon:yes gene_type:complete
MYNKDDNTSKETDQMTDETNMNVSGHILIRDKETGEELVNKRNAIHYGNLGALIAAGLQNQSNKIIHFMAFGNGGSSVDSSGTVLYKAPNTSESTEPTASLFNETFNKVVSSTSANNDTANNKIELTSGTNYTDLKITCTLGLSEPSGQENFDTATNQNSNFIFDELGLKGFATSSDNAELLTHVIFHPVQKSLNRVIEVVYTVRIQLS